MKLVFDQHNKTDTILMEGYYFAPVDIVKIHDFCKLGMSTPETIGGVYYTDLQGMHHYVELSNQSLYVMLMTFYYLSQHKSFSITYDDQPAAGSMLSFLFRRPLWFIKIFQQLGIIKPKITYSDFIQVMRERSRPTEAVPGEVRS